MIDSYFLSGFLSAVVTTVQKLIVWQGLSSTNVLAEMDRLREGGLDWRPDKITSAQRHGEHCKGWMWDGHETMFRSIYEIGVCVYVSFWEHWKAQNFNAKRERLSAWFLTVDKQFQTVICD